MALGLFVFSNQLLSLSFLLDLFAHCQRQAALEFLAALLGGLVVVALHFAELALSFI